jgi:hypothetical protein
VGICWLMRGGIGGLWRGFGGSSRGVARWTGIEVDVGFIMNSYLRSLM